MHNKRKHHRSEIATSESGQIARGRTTQRVEIVNKNTCIRKNIDPRILESRPEKGLSKPETSADASQCNCPFEEDYVKSSGFDHSGAYLPFAAMFSISSP